MSMSDRLRRLFLDRPLLAVWTSLLVLPIVASLLGRRHRRDRQLAHPYPDYPALPFNAASTHATGEPVPTVTRFDTSVSPR